MKAIHQLLAFAGGLLLAAPLWANPDAPLTVAEVLADPSLRPTLCRLVEPFSIPLKDGEQVVGALEIPAGTRILINNLSTDSKLYGFYQKHAIVVPVGQTDFLEEAAKAKRLKAQLADNELRAEVDAAVSAAIKAERQRLDNAIDAELTVFQITDDGVLATGWGETGPVMVRNVTHSKQVPGTGLNSHLMETKVWTERVAGRRQVKLPERIFVRCDSSSFVDGDTIHLRIISDGRYSYTTVLGAKATVAAYVAID